VTKAFLKNAGERSPEFPPSKVAKDIVIGSFADDFSHSHFLNMTRCLARNGARRRHPGAARRLAVIGLLSAVWCLLFSSGCTTTRKTAPPAPAVLAPAMAPAPAPELKNPPSTTVPVAPPLTAVQVVPPAAPSEASSPLAELTMLVESVPPGATIVVDGRPVGKTPLHLSVPATPLGFFRDYVEIRARFVATDETEVSRTATEEFTPREKVPAIVQFTPDGAQRTVR
jgi:hypothetical protein